jgi:hypothetical protein
MYIYLLQSNVPTDEDDRALIEAHQHHGNRWSASAKILLHSENSMKNHCSSTKRSLV